MTYLGGFILAGFLVYFSFTATNSFGLKEQTGPAVIVGKGYHAAGKTYTTQKIGNRVMTLPQITPETYVLELDIEDKTTTFAVSKQIYDRLDVGNQINAVYQRKRITGGLQVVEILP
jgi:hypothetical protein